MTPTAIEGHLLQGPSIIFEVFEELRRQGLPLGLTEYLTLATAAEEGKGLESFAQFKRLCRLLWATSTDDYAVIDQAFATIVDPWLDKDPVGPNNPPETDSPPTHGTEVTGKKKKSHDVPPRLPQGKEPSPDISPLGQPKIFPLGGRKPSTLKGSYGKRAHRFVMTPRWPVPLRTLATTWRVLRQSRRQGPAVEWDVDGTLHRLAQAGLFLGPVFRPAKINQAQLLLLIDQGGSMVPFSPLLTQVKDSLHAYQESAQNGTGGANKHATRAR